MDFVLFRIVFRIVFWILMWGRNSAWVYWVGMHSGVIDVDCLYLFTGERSILKGVP